MEKECRITTAECYKDCNKKQDFFKTGGNISLIGWEMPASAGMTAGHSVIPANAGISFVVKIQNPPVSEVLRREVCPVANP